jgi:hypothetical protein
MQIKRAAVYYLLAVHFLKKRVFTTSKYLNVNLKSAFGLALFFVG